MVDVAKLERIMKEIIEGQKGWRESGYRPPLGGPGFGKKWEEVVPQNIPEDNLNEPKSKFNTDSGDKS